jgi:ribosomal protein S27E
MAIEAYDAWLCVDCGLIIANDDDSGIEDAAQHREDMRQHLASSDGFLVVSGCPEGEACEDHDSEDDCRYDRHFSSVQCDGCGTTLAGYRFAAAELIEITPEPSEPND